MRETLYREEEPLVRKTADLRIIPIKDRPKVEDGTIAAIFLMMALVGAVIFLMVV